MYSAKPRNETLRHPEPRVARAEKLDLTNNRLATALNLTQDEQVVRANASAQVIGGLALATNRMPRLAAAGLAASLVPTTAADPRVFLHSGRSEHPAALADLVGRRFVTTDEVDDGDRLSEGLIKRVTGNPTIKARFMRQNPFEFTVQFKLWMLANHKPEIGGQDEGIWSRVKLVPFDHYFPPEKRIKGLSPILVRDEGPGILAWLVRGCLEWQRQGLREPARVIQATRAYRSEQDVLGDFLEQCCQSFLDHEKLRDQAREKASAIYSRYTDWCKDNGEKKVLTSRKMGSELRARGYTMKCSNGCQYRCGIQLKPGQNGGQGGDADD